MGSSGGIPGVFEVSLEAGGFRTMGDILGPFQGLPGPFQGHFGPILGHFRPVSGPLWGPFPAPVFGTFQPVSGLFQAHFQDFGVLWPIWGPFLGVSDLFEGIWGLLRPRFGFFLPISGLPQPHLRAFLGILAHSGPI